MKKYSDYQKNKNKHILTDEELKKIQWTKYKIIVPSEQDKKELMESFKHFHDEGYNSDFITCNQLAHEYSEGINIIVDESLFNNL